jgi:hypothetical protein
MTLQDKAKDLINTFYYSLPNNGSQEGLNSTTRRYAEAKHCALIAVDEIVNEYQSMSDLDSILFINNEHLNVIDKLAYWIDVKKEIEKI